MESQKVEVYTMIIVTGGAGFIGSNIVKRLNTMGRKDIIIVDNLDVSDKWKNLRDLQYLTYIDKNDFLKNADVSNVDIIIHMGACTNTTETNTDYLMENNFKYSEFIYKLCRVNNIRLIYASSAAVYGDGTQGYDDAYTDIYEPLNMYGYSKKLFDQFTVRQVRTPPQCVGLRFFNVYGPNEGHKGNMASVVYHSYHQAKTTGKIKLFKSYKQGVKDGEQQRDFIYVNDVCNIIMYFILREEINGIYNVGTGKCRMYYEVARAVFKAMNLPVNIEYIDMPENLRDKYQYFTEAKIDKLSTINYCLPFYSIEEGIKDYVQNYLDKE